MGIPTEIQYDIALIKNVKTSSDLETNSTKVKLGMEL
jgi:hypothetical protein